MNMLLRAALAAQLLAWTAAQADGARPALADPANPKVAVPEAKYESAFKDYRRYEDAKLRSWREANDEAAALGGHRGQVKGEPPIRKDETPSAPAARRERGAR